MDDSGVHDMYKPVLSAGLGFGANRWVATLDRQCERLASALATDASTTDIGNLTLSLPSPYTIVLYSLILI